jgi:rhamnopyranosyl-N-acetylglucosaminyl-diphospho-decaprenol beta-1,3/1,4-galactofuranosyltransferase
MPGESPSRIRIAAVVPSFNRCAALEKCIDSLMHQTRRLDAIRVVDNASTDGTDRMLEARFPGGVTLTRLQENTGSAGGFYEGVRLAYDEGYDWIWCMDNDAEPARDSLEILTTSPAFSDPGVGALAALVVDQDSKIQAMHHKRAVIPFERGVLVDEVVDGRREIPLVANGWAGVLIRRSAIHAAGLPRRELFVFCDDVEYTYRISKSFRVLLIPGSKVLHKSDSRWIKKGFAGRTESVRWPSDQPWRLYYDIRNRVFFVTRNASTWVLPVVLPLILARKVAGIVLFDDERLRRLRNLLRAARDGILGRLHEPADLQSW